MPRSRPVLAALALAGATGLALTAAPAVASTPSDSGTVTAPSSGTVTATPWSGTVAGANANSDCSQSTSDTLNDHHTAKIALPSADFYATHTVTATFTITPDATFDAIQTLQRNGTNVSSADNGSTGGAEVITLTNPAPGSYDVIACAFAGGGNYTGSLVLKAQTPGSGAIPGGFSAAAKGTVYRNYVTPSYGSDAGEPSIGSDWKTGAVMFQAGLHTIRAQFPADTGTPTFADVPAPNTSETSLDPALFTDAAQGRTLVDQLLTTTSALAYTDDDGANYTPGAQLASPGVDHQTIGAGSYPSPLPTGVTGPATSFPDAVYYCSQGVVAAFCQRSDTGGTVFQNPVPIYTTADGCGGLHGHVRVAPDGTVYVPNKSCGTNQAVTVSTDAGTTWTVKHIPGSSPGSSDPSVTVGRGGRVYFAWEDGNNHPYASVSNDKGNTWSKPIDVGASMGIAAGVFPTIIAGDNDRAAFAFLGTTTSGDPNANSFGESTDGSTYTGGTWDLYISTTVDGGASWNTVDVTPNNPVQRGAICQAGTTCSSSPNTRNLLDYMDITVDRQGRAVSGYADGCTGACVTSTKVSDNPLSSQGVISRQIAGPLLFTSDPLGTSPGTDVPEAPAPALLVVLALLVLGGGWVLRRRVRRPDMEALLVKGQG